MIHVISIGGSACFGERVDIAFLRRFSEFVKRSRDEFHIVVGGGRIAREYQKMGEALGLGDNSLDWIGIAATRLNAELLGRFLKTPEVIANPEKPGKSRVNIYSGWKPGFSTDYVSVVLAKRLDAKRIINITRVGYLYDRDPSKKGAKKLYEISKREMAKRFRNRWSPGLKFPLDPMAVKDSTGIEIAIVGNSIENIKKAMESRYFQGTLVYD
jgi:uridylate kinase